MYAKALKIRNGSTHYHPLNTIQEHPRHSAAIEATADTGCMSCLAGVNLLSKLGLSVSTLIPVTTQMKSANNDKIDILGAIFIELSGVNEYGTKLLTKQMVYISKKTKPFYLSRSACQDLHIISNEFPKIGENGNQTVAAGQSHPPVQETRAIDVVTSQLAPCGCPKRTLPPPIKIPTWELSDKNREKQSNFY